MGQAQEKQATQQIGLGDILATLWRSLRTPRTTFYLLVVIAAGSVIGILVPQGQEIFCPPFNLEIALNGGVLQAFTSYGKRMESLVIRIDLGYSLRFLTQVSQLTYFQGKKGN